MHKLLLTFILPLLIIFSPAGAQSKKDTTVYLITCGSGTETYSIYGHSALRVLFPNAGGDIVYNWGVFDFDTPNFTWKFAKGKLDYMLDAEPLQRFIQTYIYEQRYVWSQKLNIMPHETARLIALINENLRPENLKYRYDFFYDDCSTRIRDLIEKSVGKSLLYPPEIKENRVTFRKLVGKYQDPYPWMKLGVDLIMGSSGDKAAPFRDRMFLPDGLQTGLSQAVINRDGKMIPLLQNPEVLLDFPAPSSRPNFLKTPVFIFTLLLIIIIILTALMREKKINNIADLIIYSIFSVLALLMIFFNFFTDHPQMRMNLNILWLNPVIFICLGAILVKKDGLIWFRILFFISLFFILLFYFLPQEFNSSFLPLVVILLVRSSVRTGFEWNPLALK